MAHHKRGKPKSARSGCLLCKPHKMNGYGGEGRTIQEMKADEIQAQQISDFYQWYDRFWYMSDYDFDDILYDWDHDDVYPSGKFEPDYMTVTIGDLIRPMKAESYPQLNKQGAG